MWSQDAGSIGMLSRLGQECVDTSGQNRVKQKMRLVWKRFGFFWGSLSEWIWSEFVGLDAGSRRPMYGWILCGRLQPESAHPLAAFRWFQSRWLSCFNRMADNSDVSQQRIQSSLESSCVFSCQGTEAGKSRTSFCKVFRFPLQCLAQNSLLKSQAFLVFYPKQMPAANCDECNTCINCWGLNV